MNQSEWQTEALIQIGFAEKHSVCERQVTEANLVSGVLREEILCMCVKQNKYIEGFIPQGDTFTGNMLPVVYCPRFQIDKYGYIGCSAMVFTLMSEIICCKTRFTMYHFLKSFCIFWNNLMYLQVLNIAFWSKFFHIWEQSLSFKHS